MEQSLDAEFYLVDGQILKALKLLNSLPVHSTGIRIFIKHMARKVKRMRFVSLRGSDCHLIFI